MNYLVEFIQDEKHAPPQVTAHKPSQEPEHDFEQEDLHPFLHSVSTFSFSHDDNKNVLIGMSVRNGNVLLHSCRKNTLLGIVVSFVYRLIIVYLEEWGATGKTCCTQ